MKINTSGELVPKYRSRLEIISLMLEILSKGPTIKSRLMYGAYLSYGQINSYLNHLLASGLVTPDLGSEGGQPMYSLTERGLRALRTSERMAELLRPHTREHEDKRGVAIH